MSKLLKNLEQCKHENKSLLLEGDRLQTCFECGTTKRPDETAWVQPMIWRVSAKESIAAAAE